MHNVSVRPETLSPTGLYQVPRLKGAMAVARDP